MRFEEEGDQSIEQDSMDILKLMFKHVIQDNEYIDPYAPHLRPKFLAWGSKGSFREFNQLDFGSEEYVEKSGLVYVPNTCSKSDSQCIAHVALHG